MKRRADEIAKVTTPRKTEAKKKKPRKPPQGANSMTEQGLKVNWEYKHTGG